MNSNQTSNYIVLSSNKNNFQNKFKTAIHLDEKLEYEIALVSVDLYYCFPNITEKNNVFRYSEDSGNTWKEIKVPQGCYDLNSLYLELCRLKPDTPSIFTFSAITSRVRSVILINNSKFQIDFSHKKSFGKLLGFSSILSNYYNESPDSINMLNINSIFVKTNLAAISYL